MNVKAKERWEKDIDKYDLEHLRLRQIGKLINEINPSSYVDLGCGKGKLGTLTPNAEYVGCDFAMSEGNHNFKFFYCDFNNEQLPAQIYGHPLFACSGLLEYIENVDGFLKQINDALTKNGRLVISYFNMNHISRILAMLKGRSFPVHTDWRSFFSPTDFIKKLEQNGFLVERIVPVSHGLKSSTAVGETLNNKLVLPLCRFYSKQLAHQLIFICLKK